MMKGIFFLMNVLSLKLFALVLFMHTCKLVLVVFLGVLNLRCDNFTGVPRNVFIKIVFCWFWLK